MFGLAGKQADWPVTIYSNVCNKNDLDFGTRYKVPPPYL